MKWTGVWAFLVVCSCVWADDKWSWGKEEGKKEEVAPRHASSGGFVRVPTKTSGSEKDVKDHTKKPPAVPEGRTFGFFKKLSCKFRECHDDYHEAIPLYSGPGPVYPAYPGPYPAGPIPIPVPFGPEALPPIAAPVVGLPVHGGVGYPPIEKPQATNTQVHHHTHTHVHEGSKVGHGGESPYKLTGYPPKKTPVAQRPIKSGVFAPTVIGNPGHLGHGASFGLNQGQNPQKFPPLTGHPEVETDTLYRPPNTIYSFPCECVLPHHCSHHDIVSKDLGKDISYLVNPRNEAVTILSNGTDDSAYRNKRDTLITNRQPVGVSSAKPSGRAIGAFPPGFSGCGHNYVCCRTSNKGPHRSLDTCGKSFKSSIHGRIANPDYRKGVTQFGQYPWQAAILKDDGRNYKNIFVCGGTLITWEHVLTAAHCIIDEADHYLKIRLGEWDVNSEAEFYPHIELPAYDVVIHPQYYAGNLNNDIAVITIKGYIDPHSHPHIGPVCLPNPYTDFTHQHCVVTGWGKDAFSYAGEYQQILKEVDVPVVDRRSCEYALQEAKLGRDYHLPQGFICAGGEHGKDSCKGDGGGPLVCPNGYGDYELAGLVSWGLECGIEGIPGVYVNIPYYVEWIKTITGY